MRNVQHKYRLTLFLYPKMDLSLIRKFRIMQKFCLSVLLIIFFLYCGTERTFSQETRTEIRVNFKVNSAVIDSTYADNANAIRDIKSLLCNIRKDSTIYITEVAFYGAASPEGSYELNHGLARRRRKALEIAIRDKFEIPDSLITRDEGYIPMEYLRNQVEEADIELRDEILSILNENPRLVPYQYPGRLVDHRILKLKRLDEQRIWDKLYNLYFTQMRNAYVVIVTRYRQSDVYGVSEGPVTINLHEINPILELPHIISNVAAAHKSRFYSVKTNLLFWAILTANIGFEIELWPKWSLDIPILYSPYDISPNRKIRLLAVQPELRRWLKKAGESHFFGLHTHVAGFNVAVNDGVRYQDPNHALWGMGISYGYATHLDRSKHWGLEFKIGAGIAEYDYDVYGNSINGQLFRSGSDYYFGITSLGITLSYKWYKTRKNRRWMKW